MSKEKLFIVLALSLFLLTGCAIFVAAAYLTKTSPECEALLKEMSHTERWYISSDDYVVHKNKRIMIASKDAKVLLDALKVELTAADQSAIYRARRTLVSRLNERRMKLLRDALRNKED